MHRANDVTIANLTIEGCKRNSHWGVVDISNSNNVVLDNVHCISNMNSAGPSCISAWSTTITINNMSAKKSRGSMGGVLAMTYSTVHLEKGGFSYNKATYSGGGAYFYHCHLTLFFTTFVHNEAREGGGALTIQV